MHVMKIIAPVVVVRASANRKLGCELLHFPLIALDHAATLTINSIGLRYEKSDDFERRGDAIELIENNAQQNSRRSEQRSPIIPHARNTQ